MSAGQVLVW